MISINCTSLEWLLNAQVSGSCYYAYLSKANNHESKAIYPKLSRLLNVLQRTKGDFFPSLMPGLLYKQKGTSRSCIYHFAVQKVEPKARSHKSKRIRR
jgi:hypothetical protein